MVEEAKAEAGGPSKIPTLAFAGAYVGMTVFSLVVHGWVTIRGWGEDGVWWGILYLCCFIYAELYWAYRAFQSEGITLFVIASAACGLWWVGLLIFRKNIPAGS